MDEDEAELAQDLRELRFFASLLLVLTGSLSRVHTQCAIVLPKMRTPGSGLTVRSLSHQLTVHTTEVRVEWRAMPWVNVDEDMANVLIVPLPYRVEPTWFIPSKAPQRMKSLGADRYFAYAPDYQLNVAGVLELLGEARKRAGRIHAIVFPESAITLSDLRRLQDALFNEGSGLADNGGVARRGSDIPVIVAGIRSEPAQEQAACEARYRRNAVCLSVCFAAKWYDLWQYKHHRWKLTQSQLESYSLASVLSGAASWWEDLPIPPRKLSFMTPNGWLCLVPLLCEDLAQLEPCAELLRGVGPTLLIALLLDGPQLPARWPGRYASVFADDPGTSVFTVTSLGMATRSVPPGGTDADRKRTVALWKDQFAGLRPLDLPVHAAGIVITIAAHWREEFTAEGRSDGRNAAVFALHQTTSVLCDAHLTSPAGSFPSIDKATQVGGPEHAKLWDLSELTLFTYLVDAAVDCGPGRWSGLGAVFSEEGPRRNRRGVLDWRTSKDVLDRIRPRLAQLREKAGGDKRRMDFELGVEVLTNQLRRAWGRFESMQTTPPATHRETWWRCLVDVAGELLEGIRSVVPRAPMAAKNLKAVDVARVDLSVARALLWAVHTRLADKRLHGSLEINGEKLLDAIEAQLDRPDDWLIRDASRYEEEKTG